MATAEKIEVPSFLNGPEIEFGATVPRKAGMDTPSRLIIASYNIRYAVGQFLISTGLLRKAGFNLPRNRAQKVGQNINLAARTFSEGLRLPPVDILALQEADNGTARTGGHHVARELAEQLEMSWV